MSDWVAAKDGQGRAYYYNSQGVTQWEAPPGFLSPEQPTVPGKVFEEPIVSAPVVQISPPAPTLPVGWAAAQDPSGRTYYYNSSTGSTSWTVPEDPFRSSAVPLFQPLEKTPETTTTVVQIINNSTSSNALQSSGFIDCCGCCGNCEWVQVTVDEERIETIREERGCCCACDPPQKVESVEFNQLLSARGVEGWVPNCVMVFFGVFFGIIRGLKRFFSISPQQALSLTSPPPPH